MMYITNCICNGFVHFYKGDYICIYSLQSVWSYFLSIKAIKTIFNRYELTLPLIFHNREIIIEYFGSTLNAYSLFSHKWWVLKEI
jgi:hypothetical protein